jgi:hypothetical protein
LRIMSSWVGPLGALDPGPLEPGAGLQLGFTPR